MGEWQPMDTAPRDGTPVIVHECGEVVIAYWRDSIKKWIGPRDNYGDADYMQPDAWMPLPPPPTADR